MSTTVHGSLWEFSLRVCNRDLQLRQELRTRTRPKNLEQRNHLEDHALSVIIVNTAVMSSRIRATIFVKTLRKLQEEFMPLYDQLDRGFDDLDIRNYVAGGEGDEKKLKRNPTATHLRWSQNRGVSI